MTSARFRTCAGMLACIVATACSAPAPEPKNHKPPGLEAQPARVALLCVTPGCDTTHTVRFNVVGSRRVAIKRVFLSGADPEELSLTVREEAPFILGSNAGFDVQLRYAPVGSPMPAPVELRVTYTDASAEESEDRLAPGEVVVPLVRRLVGEPVLAVAPGSLSFGYVASGESKTLPLHATNEGFGNIALEVGGVDAGVPELTAQLPDGPAVVGAEGLTLPVTFAPQVERYVHSELTVFTTAADVAPVVVQVAGTSVSGPRLGVAPAREVDFGEVAVGKSRALTLELVNEGGAPLTLHGVSTQDATGNLTATLPGAGAPLVLSSLERVALTLTLDGKTSGEVDAVVTVTTDDPQQPAATVQVAATVTEPRLVLAPDPLDFGTLPVGWVVKQPVELRNVGFGRLTVKDIRLVSGSSNLFVLSNLPTLPFELERDSRIALDVQFTAETASTFTGWLSVETDAPGTPFSELALKATVGSCASSCPIAHGSPTCSTGTCDVASCDTGWFNTDEDASNGCECQEVGTDPGAFCADSHFAGTLVDADKDQATFSGVLPVDGDVDVIRFFAKDAFTVLNENFNVKVRLDSSDPNIRLCVYRYDTGAHQSDCFWTNEVCPANNTFQKSGSGVSGDDADYIVKVTRTAGTAATCTSYTLFMSNGL